MANTKITFEQFVASRKKENSVSFCDRMGMDSSCHDCKYVFVYCGCLYIEINSPKKFNVHIDRDTDQFDTIEAAEKHLWDNFAKDEAEYLEA